MAAHPRGHAVGDYTRNACRPRHQRQRSEGIREAGYQATLVLHRRQVLQAGRRKAAL